MKIFNVKNKNKFIVFLFLVFCISCITFALSKVQINNLKGDTDIYNINEVNFNNFTRSGNSFISNKDKEVKVLSQNINIHNYRGYYVKFDVYVDNINDNDVIYLDLFNYEKNYDSDRQQMSFKLKKGLNQLEGLLQTQIAPQNAQLRIVFTGEEEINITINNIFEISSTLFFIKSLSKVIGAISIAFIIIILFLTSKSMKKVNINERDCTIDIMKGIGVYLVIMGHMVRSDQVGEGVWSYIYSFHMPMFFIISGYLFKVKENYTWLRFLKNKTKHILIPYTVLFFVSFFFYNAIMEFKVDELKNIGSLIKAYFLSGNYLDQSSVGNFPLWFLPLLFIAINVFYFISKIKNIRLFIVTIIAVAILSIPFQSLFEQYCILQINVLPVAIVFMAIGYMFKRLQNRIKDDYRITLLCFLIGMIIAALKHSLSVMNIETLLYYLGASCTVYSLYRSLQGVEIEIIRYVGENSLITYGIHVLVITLCWKLQIENILFKNYSGMALLISNVTIVYIVDFIICKIYFLVRDNLKVRNTIKNKLLN